MKAWRLTMASGSFRLRAGYGRRRCAWCPARGRDPRQRYGL